MHEIRENLNPVELPTMGSNMVVVSHSNFLSVRKIFLNSGFDVHIEQLGLLCIQVLLMVNNVVLL